MQQRMSIITLGVADLQKSRAFYEKLGWKIATQKQADSIVAFNLQSFTLALYPVEKLAVDANRPMSLSSSPSFTLAYTVNSEKEVDQVLNEAKAVGASIVKEAHKAFWGGYSGYFSDLDGYLWEVAFNPFVEIKDDGAFQWV